MGSANFSVDLLLADVKGVATTNSDAATAVVTPGWYWLSVSGQEVAVNVGAAAVLATCAHVPIGVHGPFYIANFGVDGKLHAIGASSGRIDLLPASPM